MNKNAISDELKKRVSVERGARTNVANQLKHTLSVGRRVNPSNPTLNDLQKSYREIRPKGPPRTILDINEGKTLKRTKQIKDNLSTKVPSNFTLQNRVNSFHKVNKTLKASKVLGGMALAGGAAYGGHKLYKHLTNKQDIEKTAVMNGFVDEFMKIAQEEKSQPPKWMGEVADVAGFIGGAAVGSYTGDIIAHKLMKIKDPKLKNFARYAGAGLAGYATMKALPALKKLAPNSIKDTLGIEDK